MYLISEDHLAHHGIKGQKWGIRRYRNADGTLTEAGKKRYIRKIQKADNAKIREYYRNVNAGKRYAYGERNPNVTAVKEYLGEQLRKSSEYKRYNKALDDLEMFEIDAVERDLEQPGYSQKAFSSKKYSTLQSKYDAADAAYSKKIGEVYLRNSDSIVKAKLRDLNLPDNVDMASSYKEYMRKKFPSLSEETLNQIIN